MSKLRCAIYTRKSTSEGLDMAYNSLDAQRDACAAYIRSQAGEGWSAIRTTYDDGGFSGGSMERPALQRLMADIDAGRVDVVVVYKVDRLTRSLSDFAKIVGAFDAANVSFVSVTQSFNTTTSMGRLTLNILLSFAQFEREVTGERIRDKFAASKQRGMWMGGHPPLGYDVKDRGLVVNEAEAATVRMIFTRYLQATSVIALRDALHAEGVRSKCWVTRTGRTNGGHPLTHGALFHMLANRHYIGEIVHKKAAYPGLHAPIVDRSLFDEVAAKLKNRGPSRASRQRARASTHALTGRIFDDAGNPMSPSHARKGERRYRYYISSALLSGHPDKAGSLPRVSAGAIEDAVAAIAKAEACSTADPLAVVHRVEVGRERLMLSLDGPDGAPVVVARAITLRHRHSAQLIRPEGHAPTPQRADDTLIKALALTTRWATQLEAGEVGSIDAIARNENRCERYTAQILPLAYLAPDLAAKILHGRQPASMTLAALTDTPLPLTWAEQRRRFAAFD